jgi:hypothetical protein
MMSYNPMVRGLFTFPLNYQISRTVADTFGTRLFSKRGRWTFRNLKLVRCYAIAGTEKLKFQKTPISSQNGNFHFLLPFVERQKLTTRMMMRRFTRLTNGFFKRVENHVWSIALHYLHYNFRRTHQSLRVTPAMAAGISDHVWDVEDIAKLLEQE